MLKEIISNLLVCQEEILKLCQKSLRVLCLHPSCASSDLLEPLLLDEWKIDLLICECSLQRFCQADTGIGDGVVADS